MERPAVSLSGLVERRDELAARVERCVPRLVALYVFGSTVTGDQRVGSDVDLAILAEGPVGAEQRFELQDELAEVLGVDVDLVDLRTASTVLQMQVVSKGRVLVERDARARVVFEDFVFSSYARLNEERRDILAQVFRDGRVYGG